MDKIKTVKLTPENQISVIELSNWSQQKRAEAIGADCIEIVKTQRMYDFFGDTVVMIVVLGFSLFSEGIRRLEG